MGNFCSTFEKARILHSRSTATYLCLPGRRAARCTDAKHAVIVDPWWMDLEFGERSCRLMAGFDLYPIVQNSLVEAFHALTYTASTA